MSEFRGYDQAHEDTMRLHSASLPEDHRRRSAAVEALKIGRDGITYVAEVLGMSRHTICTGIHALEAMGEDGGAPPQRPSGDAKRIRRRGGGRPKVTQRQAGLE
jgi:transposase